MKNKSVMAYELNWNGMNEVKKNKGKIDVDWIEWMNFGSDAREKLHSFNKRQ